MDLGMKTREVKMSPGKSENGSMGGGGGGGGGG